MQTEFTAIFAIGTTEDLNRHAVMLKTNSGVVEENVRVCGASEIAGRCGFYDFERQGSINRMKYKNGVYKVDGCIDFEGGIDVKNVESLLAESALHV